MDCNKASDLISLSIDQMLSEDEHIELQEHLATCDGCREEYELFQSIQSALSSEEAASLPENFHSELMERIEKESVLPTDYPKVIPLRKPLYKRFDYKRFNVAAAIVVVLIFGVIGVTNLNDLYQSSDEMVMEMEMSTKTESTKSAPVEEEKQMSKADSGTPMAVSNEAPVAESRMAGDAKVANEVDMATDASVETADEDQVATVEVAEMADTEEVALEEVEVSEDATNFTISSEDVAETDAVVTMTVTTEETMEVQFSESAADQATSEMQREDGISEKSLKGTEEPLNEEVVKEDSNQTMILITIVSGIIALMGLGILIFRKIR